MKVAPLGVRSVSPIRARRCAAPYIATLAVKKASSTIWPIAPLVGTHLPCRSGITAPRCRDRDERHTEPVQRAGRQVADEPLVPTSRPRSPTAEPHRGPGPVEE